MMRLRSILVIAALLATAATPASSIGQFEGHADIGAPKLPGSASYRGGAYAISAGGYNIARARDEFHFVWRKVKGDFSIDARVLFTGPGVTPHRKAGVMARAGLNEGAAHVDATVHGDGPRSVVVRLADGATSEITELEPRVAPAPGQAAVPRMVHLDRRGDRFTIRLREPGKPELAKVVEAHLPAEIYLGLFLSAHNPDATETVRIDKVRVTARR